MSKDVDKDIKKVFDEAKDLVDLVTQIVKLDPKMALEIMEKVRWVYETTGLNKEISDYAQPVSLTNPIVTSFGVEFSNSLANIVSEDHVGQAKDAWPKLEKLYNQLKKEYSKKKY